MKFSPCFPVYLRSFKLLMKTISLVFANRPFSHLNKVVVKIRFVGGFSLSVKKGLNLFILKHF